MVLGCGIFQSRNESNGLKLARVARRNCGALYVRAPMCQLTSQEMLLSEPQQ